MQIKIALKNIGWGFGTGFLIVAGPFFVGSSGVLPVLVWVVENVSVPAFFQLVIAGIPIVLFVSTISTTAYRWVAQREQLKERNEEAKAASRAIWAYHLLGAALAYAIVMGYLNFVVQRIGLLL